MARTRRYASQKRRRAARASGTSSRIGRDQTIEHLVAAAAALSAVAAWNSLSSPFNAPKSTIVMLFGVALLAAWVVSSLRERTVRLPAAPAMAAVAAVGVGVTLAVLVAPSPQGALFGRLGATGRHIGGALYLACLVLTVMAARSHRDPKKGWRPPVVLARYVLGATAVLATYGLLQLVDAEPWSFGRGDDEIPSLLGNPNFLAAWLAIALPLVAWRAVHPLVPAERALAVAVTLAGVVVLLATGSAQGPLAAAPGLALAAAVARPWREVGRRTLVVTAVVAVAVVVSVATSGRVGELKDDVRSSFDTREANWAVAGRMLSNRPLTGYGFGQYIGWYREYRPADDARTEQLEKTADDPHSVPLAIAASGGAPFALAYLAFVLLTAFALVLGIRAHDGAARAGLGAVGGAWLTYQIQSVVSVDVAPLAAAHWILAGIILAAAPWSPMVLRRRRRVARPRAAGWQLVTASIVAVALAWVVVVPVRAAASEGDSDHPDAARALDAIRTATDAAPWEPRFHDVEAQLLLRGRHFDEAEAALLEAFRRDRRSFPVVLRLARLAAHRERGDEALHWYRRALDLDPHSSELGFEAGKWLVRHDLEAAAVPFLEQGLRDGVRRRRSATLFLLGRARARSGDEAGARQAWVAIPQDDPWRARADKALAAR